jgi:hypothetical protein
LSVEFNNKWYYNHFKNVGYVSSVLTNEQMRPIHDSINKIQSDFKSANSFTHKLAGNISHEYGVTDCLDYVEELLTPMVYNFVDQFEFESKQVPANGRKGTPKIVTMWANFQRKGEFNPHHIHFGLLSFVLWVKVPYLIEEENDLVVGVNPKEKRPGNFTFTFCNALGEVCPHDLPVDRTWENVVIIFPAQLPHLVYPFYSSDDYRISMSGNFEFRYD